ncbi:MAG: hypothetical protein AAF518_20730 [Spirochaetota bacterium]
MLEQRKCVTIIETTFPVNGDFATASDIIIQAHYAANRSITEMPVSQEIIATKKPNFAVLYRQTMKEMGIEKILQQYATVIDGIVLEWDDEEFIDKYSSSINQADVECIVSIVPSMTTTEIKRSLNKSIMNGMIYLGCAPVTAGKMDDLSHIKKCAQDIKTIAPHVTITAGMGIKQASDIRQLASIQEINAVVVGTSFLQAIGQGKQYMEEFLDKIEESLSY